MSGAAIRGARAETAYAVLLFLAALVALALSWGGPLRSDSGLGAITFFLAYGLFTVSIGYSHPSLGYVSFDRVAQAASILVLGPVDAAWVNGLVSLVYPWHRLRKGVPMPEVVRASLMNSGLMTLVVLTGGLLYATLGGALPLTDLGLGALGDVILMLLAMQLINESGMMLLARIRGKPAVAALSGFDTLMELSSGMVGVLVAVVWARMDLEVLLLLLAVLAAGMLALRNFAEMRLRLERLVGERTAALEEKTQQLERLATQDTLTGLHNRRHADAVLEREFRRARDLGVPLSVALADVDHFKHINDGHSHAVGDRVLERVARIFAAQVREADLVARYGGEEFLFCLVGCGPADAGRLCEELRRAVEAEPWESLSPGLRVTLSAGVASLDGEDCAAALLARADARLYEAKRLGRNRIVAQTLPGA